MLTQERLKELLEYNPDTGFFHWLTNRGKAKKGDVAGRLTGNGYTQIGIDGRVYLSARLAFLYMTGAMPEEFVDHINHIKADNRWDNLRPVTHVQNSRNVTLHNTSTSGVCGVTWKNKAKKWIAQGKFGGKYVYLGSFDHFHVAVEARKKWQELQGFHPNHGAPRNESH